MFNKPHTLPGVLQKRIDNVLDSKPCGRCGKDHMTKNCPMSSNEGVKGSVWKDFKGVANDSADMYLREHPNYEPVRSAA